MKLDSSEIRNTANIQQIFVQMNHLPIVTAFTHSSTSGVDEESDQSMELYKITPFSNIAYFFYASPNRPLLLALQEYLTLALRTGQLFESGEVTITVVLEFTVNNETLQITKSNGNVLISKAVPKNTHYVTMRASFPPFGKVRKRCR